MDISSASDQQSSVRLRPLSLKAAPFTSLEPESDNAVLLRREISRKFADHLPAPRRERKKSVILGFPFLPAANVVSSLLIFFLLFLHFLASVSEASRLQRGATGQQLVPTNRSRPRSPQRRNSRSSPPKLNFVYQFTNGNSFPMTFCNSDLQGSRKIFNPDQKMNRVSLYVGQVDPWVIRRDDKEESELAGLFKEGLRSSLARLRDIRKNTSDPQDRDIDYPCGYSSFCGRAERIPETVHKLIRLALRNISWHEPREIDIGELVNGREIEDLKHMVVFASVVYSPRLQKGGDSISSGAAVLIIWDPLVLPFFDSHNIGMVYVSRPDGGTLKDPESQKQAIRDSAKNVFRLLAHYQTTGRRSTGDHIRHYTNIARRWRDLVTGKVDLPLIQEYHAELIGEQFGLDKTATARENLVGYSQAPRPSNITTNLAYAGGAFLKAAENIGLTIVGQHH